MGTNKKRRTFTPEFRRQAARRVIDTNRNAAEVAREIGVSDALLRKWVAVERATIPGPEPLDDDERAELRRLRKQVADLRKDNEFLGKAAAFFASKQHQSTSSR